MTQQTFPFGIEEPDPRPWRRLSPPGQKITAHWVHASGWELRHCGHPTAIWPYHLTSPDHPGAMVVHQDGRGFRTLEQAQRAVDGVNAGTLCLWEAPPNRYGRQLRVMRHETAAQMTAAQLASKETP